MELSQLTAYAQLKFHMREQRPWPDFPGFSVLADPVTGKWAALLMRQWDSDSGEEIQRCDMRCGQQVLAQRPAPFLSKPFRMKGQMCIRDSHSPKGKPLATVNRPRLCGQ